MNKGDTRFRAPAKRMKDVASGGIRHDLEPEGAQRLVCLSVPPFPRCLSSEVQDGWPKLVHQYLLIGIRKEESKA